MSLSLSDAERKAEGGGTIAAQTYLGLFVFTLAAHGLWYVVSNSPTGFSDNDGYMRVLRVEALWQGGGWFDRSIPRVNAPYGDTYHWTRPLDVVISLLAGPLVPFLGVKPAIFWGGALSGPVLHGAAAAAFAWAALPLVGRMAATLAAIAATAQYGLISYGALDRADHHIFFVFLAALGFGFAIRALARNQGANRNAFLAGLAAAGGVWIGIEGFVFASLSLAAFGLAWLAGDDPPDAPKGFRFAAGFAFGLVGALAIELGPSFLVVEYDRISIVHATLGALLALFFLAVRLGAAAPQLKDPAADPAPGLWSWRLSPPGAARGTLRSPRARVLTTLIGAALLGEVWVLLFPKALRGPWADYDPEFVRVALGSITELGPGYTLELFPVTLGTTALAFPWLVGRLGREKSGPEFWAWAYVGMCVVVFGALTAGWARWAIYAGLFPCLVLGDMIARITEWIVAQKISPVVREAGCAFVVAFFLLGPLTAAYVTALVVAPPEKKAERERAEQACSVGLLAVVLSRPPWSERPRVILTDINYVGEILYRTPHHVVGMSYRTERFWRDVLDVFAARDDAVVREILTRRNVELIAICPGGKEGLSRQEGEFYDRLKTGSQPAWVREIALPAEAAAFRLFEVLPEGRGR